MRFPYMIELPEDLYDTFEQLYINDIRYGTTPNEAIGAFQTYIKDVHIDLNLIYIGCEFYVNSDNQAALIEFKLRYL